MIRRLFALLLLAASTAYAVETLTIDSLTRNVINVGAVNFATGQLKVNGIAVVGGGGGGGGGGGTIDNIRLNLPTALFVTPENFVVAGGLAEGTLTFVPQSPGTVFANLTGSNATPIFVTLSELKTSLALDNVNNTSDANKPISTATQAALDTLTAGVATNTSDIAALTTTVAGKADTSAMTTALAAKASITYVDTQDATKQNSWGLPAFNGYIAAGDTDGSLHWVDPVTLGTTSQTFTDGVENSTTTLTSATANFVAGDVGKTVTGDNIPAGTTIASRTNSTTVELSQAATATGSGNTFTIINRLEVGGTGTVTSVASGNLPPLFTSSVGSPSSSASITYSLSSAAANTFFGNGTALSATPTFMDAATARAALGGTTVGQNMFSLANPSAIRFLRVNADNTISALDSVTFRNAIGAGTVSNFTVTNNIAPVLSATVTTGTTTPILTFDPVNAAANTFYGNGTGSSATPTFMSASTARTSLGGTTVGQNLFTLANPSAISYPRISATNTVSAATPATVLSDIGAASSTDTRFPASVTGIRKSSGAASTDTAAVANIDYAVNSEHLIGDTGGATWQSGKTVMRQTGALTANRSTTLPPANVYAPGTILTYIDALTTTNFGRSFAPAGSDTLNGAATAITPFIAGARGTNGSKTASFETDGASLWRLLGSGSIDHIEDASNANKQITFDVSLQTAGTPGVVSFPNGNSNTIAEFPSDTGFSRRFLTGQTGGVLEGDSISTDDLPQLYQWNVAQSEVTVANANAVITPNNGQVTSVRVGTDLTQTRSYTWPSAANYKAGQIVDFYDVTGSLSSSIKAHIISGSGDTFNGASTYDITEQYASRRFKADPVLGKWVVTNNGDSSTGITQAFQTITPVSGAATWTWSAGNKNNNGKITITGTTSLTISGGTDGDEGTLLVTNNSGLASPIVLSGGSGTSGGGAGVLTFPTTAGQIHKVRFLRNGSVLMADQPITNYTFSAPHDSDVEAYRNTVISNGGTVSETTLGYLDTLMVAMKTTHAYYTSIDEMWVCAGDDSTANPLDTTLKAARTKFKFPGGASSILTNHNFVDTDYHETGASGGLTGNGSTKYLETDFLQSTLAVNTGGFGVYSNAVTTGSTLMSANSSAGTYRWAIVQNLTTTHRYSFGNQAANLVEVTGTTPAGLKVVQRDSNTSLKGWLNGSQDGTTNTTTNGGTPNNLGIPFVIFASNNGGTISSYTSARISFYVIFHGTINQSELYGDILNFQTSMTRN